VIAGEFRGRRLTAPPGTATRPTSDRVREALFSILGPLEGVRVLDLFAGSGALGIEALSRGAASAVFVERSPAAARVVRGNLKALGIEAPVHVQDARTFVRNASAAGDTYDLVLLDPPYRDAAGLSAELQLAGVLSDGARVVGESDRRAPFELSGLDVVDERRYGDTLIRIHTQP